MLSTAVARRLKQALGSAHEKFSVWTGPNNKVSNSHNVHKQFMIVRELIIVLESIEHNICLHWKFLSKNVIL